MLLIHYRKPWQVLFHLDLKTVANLRRNLWQNHNAA
jgi:hypothetical protein